MKSSLSTERWRKSSSRIERWRKRIARENRIYIMPSGRGFLFLGMVVVMILTAATYNNNLIFILAFFLFALFVVSMLQTHYNLKGVKLKFINSEEGFAQGPLLLLFHLQQKRARWKRDLRIRTKGKTFPTINPSVETLSPQESLKPARLEVQAAQRGRHELPTTILETYYPLGMFRAWKVFYPEGHVLVYPEPITYAMPVSMHYERGEQDRGLRDTPDGDFGELKTYLQGESYHQIAWKHYARTGDLYRKVHWGAEHKHYAFPWAPGRQDLETYLSVMSGWVKQASLEDASFELETPEAKIRAGRGPLHARDCWRALATVGETPL